MSKAATARTAYPAASFTEAAALERCLGPVDSEAFATGYWQQRPLHIPRTESDRFIDLLSPGDVERLVCSGGLRFPDFKLVREGDAIDVESYTGFHGYQPVPFSGSVDVARILAEWENGATIVLDGLHVHWAPLTYFCRELERALRQRVHANAYFTPRGSQGFRPHHDTHDVFILQVAGRKEWRVYEPAFVMPLRHQKHVTDREAAGVPVLQVELDAGDTLYLPRGWLHEAVTSDADSLHLTIGINFYTWFEAFGAALEACDAHIGFRRMPTGPEELRDLLDHLAGELSWERVEQRMQAQLLNRQVPVLDGQLSQLRALDSLSADSLLERRPTVMADLRLSDDGISLHFDGRHLTFAEHLEEALQFVANTDGAFTPAGIPGKLPLSERLILVFTLVREGFLRALAV